MHYFFLFLALLIPAVAFGQGFEPLTQIPGIEKAAEADGLPDFLNAIYKLCIGAAAVLALLQIIRGGLTYMLGDSVTEKKEARSLITMSVVGLILVLSPAIVFGIIDPRILNLQVDFTGLKTAERAAVTAQCNAVGDVREGIIVGESFQQCCAAAGFRAELYRGGPRYICTNQPPPDPNGDGRTPDGGYTRNVPTTPGKHTFILVNTDEEAECVQIVAGSFDDADSCTAGSAEELEEREGYLNISPCRAAESTYIPLIAASIPYCPDIITVP